MNFELPLSLNVDGIERPINPDFRDVLTILIACNSDELTQQEKTLVILNNLYVDDFTEFCDINEAYEKARWFIDWGQTYTEQDNSPKLVDWEKDYNYIISAVNKVTKSEIRSQDFVHWWTFLGYVCERGECQYSTITEIRDKLNKGKPLESYEKQFLRENKEIVILKSEKENAFERELLGGE